MISEIFASTLIASCLNGGGSYLGGTKAELTRTDDETTYRLVVEEFKGPDGDGKSGVIADESTSYMNAIHMEDGMMYQFKGWEFEVFNLSTTPYHDKVTGEVRRLNSLGDVIETTPMACDFNG